MHSSKMMQHTEYPELSPRESPTENTGTNGHRKKKKVGMYYLILNQILGSGTFSTVYFGEMDPQQLDIRKKQKYFD